MKKKKINKDNLIIKKFKNIEKYVKVNGDKREG